MCVAVESESADPRPKVLASEMSARYTVVIPRLSQLLHRPNIRVYRGFHLYKHENQGTFLLSSLSINLVTFKL